jgi:cell wall-associated NlpC family hydrolase
MITAQPFWTEAKIEEMITTARTLVHQVPWRHQGRSLKGADCVGIFTLIGRAVGFEIVLPTGYSHVPDPKILEEGLKQYADKLPLMAGLPGDFVIIKYNGKGTHLALLTDQGLLHSSAFERTVVEHSIDEEWQRGIVSTWRLKGRVPCHNKQGK